jgi:tetratricopeptide (TPR) repeat protein
MSENYMAKKLFDEGAAAYLKEDYQKSIQLFAKALQKDRKFALVYSFRGTAYLKLNQFKKAISNFSSAIRLNPKYARAYHLRGLAYEKMGDFAPAFRDFDQAIELDPDLAAAYRSRDSVLDKSIDDDRVHMEDAEMADHLAAMRVAQFAGERRLPGSEI